MKAQGRFYTLSSGVICHLFRHLFRHIYLRSVDKEYYSVYIAIMYKPPFSISPDVLKLLADIESTLENKEPGQPEPVLHMEDILQAHAAIGGEGRFRQSPPAPHWVPVLVAALLEWVNTSPIHRLIRAAVFHYELVRIRPFEAGNEKVAGQLEQIIRYPLIGHCRVMLKNADYEAALAATDASAYVSVSLCAILAALRSRTSPSLAPAHRKRRMSPQEQILHHIHRHPGSKRQDILAALPALSPRMLDRHLQTLREQQQIEYRGSRKTGAYFPGNN